METNKTETTTTAVVVAEKKPIEVNNVVFVMFAEFLGYESPLISWAEQICGGKHAPKYIEKILDVEAKTIFTEMQKEYTIDEIRNWYEQFYPLILEDYENKIVEMNKDDLPF